MLCKFPQNLHYTLPCQIFHWSFTLVGSPMLTLQVGDDQSVIIMNSPLHPYQQEIHEASIVIGQPRSESGRCTDGGCIFLHGSQSVVIHQTHNLVHPGHGSAAKIKDNVVVWDEVGNASRSMKSSCGHNMNTSLVFGSTMLTPRKEASLTHMR
jgi:hypothetical protein